MYKIMVIEDEEWVRKGLMKKIQRLVQDVEIVAEETNGQEALDDIEEKMPDIIITDIIMPIMDGLELIENVKMKYPNVKIIILTGFAEFKFAQRAISLGAAEYIIKPIGDESLLNAFNKVKQLVNDLRHEQEINNFKLPFIDLANIESAIVDNRIKDLKLLLFILFSSDEMLLSRNKEYANVIIRHILNSARSITEDSPPDVDFDCFDHLVQKYLDTISCDEIVEALFQKILYIVGQRKDIYLNIKCIVENAKVYIEENYNKSITLASLAKKYNISPSYLSRKFKEYNTLNITNYISFYRIEKAKKLISKTEMNIISIAESVGVKDAKYFFNLFKNYTGLTPAKYREFTNHQNHDMEDNII